MEFNHSEVIMLLLTAIGPLKVTIVCATLTADASPEFVKRVAFRSVLIALIVCIVFAVLGEAILRLLKVSIPAFQIGGGIIVLLFSLDMVMGSKQADKDSAGGPEEKNTEPSLDIAAYPLAIPLMASVSGLVAIVSLLAQRDDLEALLFLAAVIVAIMAINYVCLRSCRYIVRAVGPAALQVVGKIMGVILTALAVELVLMGLIGLGLHAKTGRKSVACRIIKHGNSTRRPGFHQPTDLEPFWLYDCRDCSGSADKRDWNRFFSPQGELHAVIVLREAILRANPVATIYPRITRFSLDGPGRDGYPLWPGLSMDAIEL